MTTCQSRRSHVPLIKTKSDTVSEYLRRDAKGGWVGGGERNIYPSRGETYTSCLRFIIYDYVIIHFRPVNEPPRGPWRRAAWAAGAGLVKHDYYNRSPGENVVVKAVEVTTSTAHPPLHTTPPPPTPDSGVRTISCCCSDVFTRVQDKRVDMRDIKVMIVCSRGLHTVNPKC